MRHGHYDRPDAFDGLTVSAREQGRLPMTMQSEQEHRGFLQTAGGQITLLVVALIVLLAIAWYYVF